MATVLLQCLGRHCASNATQQMTETETLTDWSLGNVAEISNMYFSDSDQG